MKESKNHWSKIELKVYILLLCAKADLQETSEEIELIKSKIDSDTFDRLHKEICEDDEDISFQKIEDVIERHHFSPREIAEIKKEVLEVFNADKKFETKERYLDKILDNIIY